MAGGGGREGRGCVGERAESSDSARAGLGTVLPSWRCSQDGRPLPGVPGRRWVTFLSGEAAQRPKVTLRLPSGSFLQGALLKEPRGDLGIQAGGPPEWGECPAPPLQPSRPTASPARTAWRGCGAHRERVSVEPPPFLPPWAVGVGRGRGPGRRQPALLLPMVSWGRLLRLASLAGPEADSREMHVPQVGRRGCSVSPGEHEGPVSGQQGGRKPCHTWVWPGPHGWGAGRGRTRGTRRPRQAVWAWAASVPALQPAELASRGRAAQSRGATWKALSWPHWSPILSPGSL